MNLKWFFLASIFIVATSVQAQRITELQFSDCLTLDDYRYSDITPFPGTPTSRQLSYGNETVKLSIEEAYRIRYSWKGQKFLDVKIEYPGDADFAKDSTALEAYYEHIARDDRMQMHVSTDSFGYRAFFADRYSLDKHIFLATDLLIDPVQKRFIYIYFWNPNQAEPLLKDMDAFFEEKKKVLKQITRCIN